MPSGDNKCPTCGQWSGSGHVCDSKAEADGGTDTLTVVDFNDAADGVYEPPSSGIGGFDYQAERYTPAGIVEQMISEGRMSPGARGMDSERAFEQLGAAEGIDPEDETSYDSDDFPKVVLVHQLYHGDTIVDASGSHVKVDLGEDLDVEHDGPITEIEDAFEAQHIARDWAAGSDGTYQFSSSGTITPDGLHDWRQTAKEVGEPDPDDPGDPAHELGALVNFLDEEAERRGLARDIDEFAEAGDLGDWHSYRDREREVTAKWDRYAKTSQPVKEYWNQERQRA